ncbi:MAG: hypothetical protein ACXQS5_00195 [Candidatus Methanospirareceae archaeon]
MRNWIEVVGKEWDEIIKEFPILRRWEEYIKTKLPDEIQRTESSEINYRRDLTRIAVENYLIYSALYEIVFDMVKTGKYRFGEVEHTISDYDREQLAKVLHRLSELKNVSADMAIRNYALHKALQEYGQMEHGTDLTPLAVFLVALVGLATFLKK